MSPGNGSSLADRITVLAVDDHPLLRGGIAAMLEDDADLELVGEASNGLQAIELYRRHRPDVMLLDIQMPAMNGIDTLTAVRSEFPNARVIMLTSNRGDMQARRAITAGASGYLLKSMLQEEFREAIRAVHAGRRYIPPEIATEIANHLGSEPLTTLEVDVLRLVANGLANKQIGARMNVTEETIKWRMKNILQKLEANDRAHAVTLAVRRGVLDID